jgi:hypothetical protein
MGKFSTIYDRQTEEALRFAKEFDQLSYFTHALELLLHRALEDDYASKTEHSKGKISLFYLNILALSNVVRFLEYFPSYLDIIVNCARKSEVSLWKFFFSIVGDAKVLFEVFFA